MRQRFYSKPGYQPKVYGYRHEAHSGDGEAIAAYKLLRFKNGPSSTYSEPPSERGQHSTLSRRHVGQQLLKKLQPEDHLIVYSADRISVSLEDFLATLRYFYERGIHLHLCEFWGTPLDCWSTPGRTVLEALTLSSEVSGLWQKPAAKKAQAAKPAKRFHDGKPVPWFCEVKDEMLRVDERVLFILRDLCFDRDNRGWSWSQLSERMYDDCEMRTGRKLAKYRGKAKEALDAYCFYKGWEERGFCDLNEISPAQIKNEYKAKLFPQETNDGEQDMEETGRQKGDLGAPA